MLKQKRLFCKIMWVIIIYHQDYTFIALDYSSLKFYIITINLVINAF